MSEGDVVTKDQDLLELETDKATMPVPSPQAGKITKVLVAEGDTVPVGGAIFEIEAEGASGNGAAKEKPAAKKQAEAPPKKAEKAAPVEEAEEDDAEDIADQQEEPAPAKKPAAKGEPVKKKSPPPPPEAGVPVIVEEDEPQEAKPAAKAAPKKKASADEDKPGDGKASAAAGPAVRRLARELGVDLRRVRSSGDSGRITEDDIHAHVRKNQAEAEAKTTKGVTPPGSPDSDNHGAVRREKMSRMRQTIARNMLQSYTTIPQLTNFDDADVTELEDMREQSKADYADRGIKLTALPFVIKAIASALKRHPMLNASVDMENNTLVYKEYVNIGIAVDTDRGLVVPVLRDADRKSISQIASELEELANTVRDGKFDLDLLKSGTFTVSNLGSVGGTYSTPLINPPQVAILLVGRNRTVPYLVEDAIVARLMMPLSITYDHRLVDGADAARVLSDVKQRLEAGQFEV